MQELHYQGTCHEGMGKGDNHIWHLSLPLVKPQLEPANENANLEIIKSVNRFGLVVRR